MTHLLRPLLAALLCGALIMAHCGKPHHIRHTRPASHITFFSIAEPRAT